MKEKFEGENAERLVSALKAQEFVGGNASLAEMIIANSNMIEFKKGEELIQQNGSDNDVYLLIAGTVGIVVNGNQIAVRKAGQHVGEMAAIEPAQARSATVVALESVVALRISSASFHKVGETYGQIWLPIARELSRRLKQRNDIIPVPNTSPKLFIISSVEAKAIAEEIQLGLQHDVFPKIWTQGVFFAGGYPLDDLERAVDESDFAVAVAQADDIVESRGSRQATLRDNVLFELGLFMGRLSRHRSILVHPRGEKLKLPSDLQGLTLLSYVPGPESDLAARLGPVCTDIKKIVKRYGVRTMTT